VRKVRSWKHPGKGAHNAVLNLRTGITVWQSRVSLCRFRGPYNTGSIAPGTRNSDIALTNPACRRTYVPRQDGACVRVYPVPEGPT